jgi:hypothetical protein
MKVFELIEKLKKLPQDAEVVVVEPEHWEGDNEEREPLQSSFPRDMFPGKVVL